MHKKYLILFTAMFLLTGCGSQEPEASEPYVVDIADEMALWESKETPESKAQEEVAKPKEIDLLKLLDAIPTQYVWRGGLKKEDLMVDVNDPENYYLSFTSFDIEGFGTLAVFLDDQGGQTVAISTTGCGPICGQDLYFLREKDGVWIDVTGEVFPKLSDEDSAKKADEVLAIRHAAGLVPEEDYFAPLYVLPQQGTTIDLIDQYDDIYGPELGVLFHFKWKNGVFVKEEVSLQK